jgi:hypothetical protein
MAGIIEVKDQGKLRIYDADNSHYIDIVVPSSVTANRTITIPDASFTVPQVTNATHSGEVTGATALTIADNIVDEANLKVSNSPTNGYMLTAQSGDTGGLTWAAAGGGKIGQVVSTHKTDATSTTSSSYEDISGMSVAITPSATSSKILVLYRLTLSNGSDNRNDSVRLLRGSTAIIDPSDFYRLGSNTYVYNASGNFLDSPSSTSELTYKFQWLVEASGHTGYLNRRGQNSTIRGHSTITVMEVLA